MPVTRADVEYVARLARLGLTEEEKERLLDDLNSILNMADQLGELDTEDVEPTHHVQVISNVFRKDEVRPSLPKEEVLANAPEEQKGMFKVPRIVGEQEN